MKYVIINLITHAYFYKGPGCGGRSQAIIDRILNKNNIIDYDQQAQYETPIDHLYVIKSLQEIGFDKGEHLIYDNEIFFRRF